MKNINLRNVLMAAGLAVFAGVLTLGVNAAFGLDAPSQDPAGAALHSPVFEGVDVQGGLANSVDDLTIYDDTIINGGLTINPAMGGVFVTGNLGKLPLNANLWVGGNSQDANSVTIDGDKGEISAEEGTLTTPNVLDAKGGIKNTTVVMNIQKPVKIDDALEVVNNAIIDGDLFATQNLTVTKNLTVSGALNTKGMWSNGGVMIIGNSINQGTFVVTDNVGLGKDLNVAGNINASGYVNVTEDLNVDGNLTLEGGGGKIMTKGTTNGGVNFDNPIVQTGWIGTSGAIAFGDYTALNSGYAWTETVSEPISVVAGQNGVFFSKGNNGTAYQTQLGKIDTSGNLSMLGNVKAAHLGDFKKVSSSKAVPWNKSLDIKTVTCPANYKVIDCYGKAGLWSNGDASVIFGRDVNFIASHVNLSNTCTVSISVEKDLPNPTGIEYIATALCFNPNAFDTGSY